MKKPMTILAILVLGATPALADNPQKDAVNNLNEILRGERSAVETYQQALKKLNNEPGSEKLRSNLADHQTAVNELSSEIQRLGGTPSIDSGAWGMWAKTVTGSAKLLGDDAALKALKEGEEHGVKEYNEALTEASISSSFKEKVRDSYLPKQREHIDALNHLMEIN